MKENQLITIKRKKLANTIIGTIAQFYQISKENIINPPDRNHYHYRHISMYFIYELLRDVHNFNQSHIIELFPVKQRSIIPKYYNQIKSQIDFIPSFRKEIKSLENFIYSKSHNVELIREKINGKRKQQQLIRNAEIVLNYKDGTTELLSVNSTYDIEIIKNMIKRNINKRSTK